MAPIATTSEVIVLPALSDAVRRACQDTVRILTAAVTNQGVVHLALTGGFEGMALPKALAPPIAAQPEEVHHATRLWFGDECLVSAGGPECSDLLVTPLIAAGIRESQTHRLVVLDKISGLDEATIRMTHEFTPVGVVHGGFGVVHVGLDLVHASAPSSPGTQPHSQ